MSAGRRHFDEGDVPLRARGGSRPRTRNRPKHEDAKLGFVTAVDRGRYTCLVEDRTILAMKARELGRGSITVGDRVWLVGDLSGRPDTLARVVRVAERQSVLRRTADDTDPVERIIVANADQLAIVSSLADPPPQPRLIDRCLVAAYDAGLRPLLCLTKADLATPDDVLATYASLNLAYVVTRGDDGLGELARQLAGRVSVLVGSSGVGKSTLVNLLVPEAGRTVGDVNPVTGRGRHTSTSAVALALADGWIIDTPGLRSFGLAHVSPDDVIAGFPDLDEAVAECPPGCAHTADSPDCALDSGVAAGRLEPARVSSLRRLLASREDTDGGGSH
ncbi:ribosome small subunit-dependent GTPase A [Halostreptopolyspora alba]|uniref:Small ribosomal subunit biogenesis GTPase RsgA n=1 Tax=Halostreptopolyspora alba TaxID=2487137 RepID=A0A3N0ECA0_9ACTN|nr:ribosome small subunit-dependent GTPase A [Nocardiopsaceae bacterium YIM 96095]